MTRVIRLSSTSTGCVGRVASASALLATTRPMLQRTVSQFNP